MATKKEVKRARRARLGRRLAIPGAWTVAAIWVVHPLHVESVVWIIERKDVLSGLFYLGAALAYLSFCETHRWSRYGLGLGSTLSVFAPNRPSSPCRQPC